MSLPTLYIPNSLKQTRRSRRGRGVRRRVVSEGKLPGNWHSFLRVYEGEQAGVVRVLIRCPAALLHKLYLKKQDPEKIPPSKGALLQHLNWALLQGSCIWGQILSPRLMTLHSPTDWGWKFCNEQYELQWSELPPMMEACMELTVCKCKKGCARSRCGCKKAELISAHYCVDVKEVVGRQTRCWWVVCTLVYRTLPQLFLQYLPQFLPDKLFKRKCRTTHTERLSKSALEGHHADAANIVQHRELPRWTNFSSITTKCTIQCRPAIF